jgi:hypothetical protein
MPMLGNDVINWWCPVIVYVKLMLWHPFLHVAVSSVSNPEKDVADLDLNRQSIGPRVIPSLGAETRICELHDVHSIRTFHCLINLLSSVPPDVSALYLSFFCSSLLNTSPTVVVDTASLLSISGQQHSNTDSLDAGE